MMPLIYALSIIGLSLLLLKYFKARLGKQRQHTEESQRHREAKLDAIEGQQGILADELDRLSKLGTLSDEALEILHLAATQQALHFDLGIEQEIHAVHYPTNKMDYVPIADASELSQVCLAELALDDDLFYHKFVNRELMRPEYYDVTETFKRLYILWDVSPSMWDPRYGRMYLPNGEAWLRDKWARAILASLLRDAAQGKAEYFLRPFSNTPHTLHAAFSKKQAAQLLQGIIKGGIRGEGTDIKRAVTTATQDLRARKSRGKWMNHILLITDGEDKELRAAQLAEDLGTDIKLHVVLIGTQYNFGHPLNPYVIAKY